METNLDAFVSFVNYDNQHLSNGNGPSIQSASSRLISKDGKPMAALVDATLFARIRQMYDHLDELSNRLTEGYSDVPEEEGLTEIDALVAEERKKR
jgi:hypothetical protein